MAEIWILRRKHKIFSLGLSYSDELQKLEWSHVDKLIIFYFCLRFSKVEMNALLNSVSLGNFHDQ